jgi:cytochrome c peroxidase
VHPQDSVLGPFADRKRRGLMVRDYAALIRAAFQPEWWCGYGTVDGEFTQMELNFSLFWGLSIMLYESTLVSDDTPFDRFRKGDDHALTKQQQEGLALFLNEGRCIACHKGPEFTGATVSHIRGVNADPNEGAIEFMVMQIGPEAFYDNGFYNIGVRPTAEDVGVGGSGPFGPFSFVRRVQNGEPLDLNVSDIPPDHRVAVDGAFKTPTLRNIELTGPFMHNGGMSTLEQVVQFYARGTDFFDQNIDNLDPDVHGIPEINGKPEKIAALVAFLHGLTDDRVRWQRAPFDHPELVIPNGHTVCGCNALDDDVVLPAVGAGGGPRLRSFEEILKSAVPGQPHGTPHPRSFYDTTGVRMLNGFAYPQ